MAERICDDHKFLEESNEQIRECLAKKKESLELREVEMMEGMLDKVEFFYERDLKEHLWKVKVEKIKDCPG